MKEQLAVLSRLASLRGTKVQQMLGRVTYQQNLCQRYRNNITGLNRLCSFTVPMTTPLQRNNQQQYKATLHKMVELQQRELTLAEENLARIQVELMAAMRSEKIVAHVIDAKMAQWQVQLNQQEQKIQDGLAAQSWWRAQG
ncbi:flagellar export protein FliJ [Cellvibrio sp. BR]|jgi:flagellar export protein FliJ|uniref:flagellar FliJ family protein n=1 Tax=unclassified Cellvibrio TaxID=2624793 RepID=UPI00026011D0|nr:MULTISPECIES: flagellar FliJ family protein [unclassified Cellvibrio]EIK45720.1 flagellar export protein FliJ [Cellvibrio sp. BR]UUA73952.1 flagellar FliJ family protein [Cellvibrio sp. QJXJ]